MFFSVSCFDCVDLNGLHVLYGTLVSPQSKRSDWLSSFPLCKGSPIMLQCFWYSLLLWNQPEIFLEHFDTILSSRCLVYNTTYTTMECSSYCGQTIGLYRKIWQKKMWQLPKLPYNKNHWLFCLQYDFNASRLCFNMLCFVCLEVFSCFLLEFYPRPSFYTVLTHSPSVVSIEFNHI